MNSYNIQNEINDLIYDTIQGFDTFSNCIDLSQITDIVSENYSRKQQYLDLLVAIPELGNLSALRDEFSLDEFYNIYDVIRANLKNYISAEAESYIENQTYNYKRGL